MTNDLFTYQTTAMAREEFFAAIHAGKKIQCPCCTRFAMVYTRTIHSIAARQLIGLYKLDGEKRFVRVKEVLDLLGIQGDLTKAKYWDLITPKTNTDTDKKTSGAWMLTEKGIAWIKNEIRLPKYVEIYDDKILKFSTQTMSIADALGEKFSYAELMA